MRKQRWGAWGCASILGGGYALGLGACSGKVVDTSATEGGDELRARSVHPAALSSGANCDRLLEHFRENLLEQVSERAEQARQQGGYYSDVPLLPGAELPVPASPAPAGNAGASAPADTSSPASGGAFSGTTVQVPGVDEADFVKADGDHLVLLHGPTLYVLDAASPTATEILGSVPIEGDASELFARDGKVVVFSRIYGPLPGVDQSSYPYYYYYYPYFTKLTVVDVRGGAPEVLRESYIEGSYTSSRRHDGIVRAILQQSSKAQLDYPNVSYVDFLGHPYSEREIDLQVDTWVTLATETIADSVIEDYLPSAYERVDGALVKQPLRCGDYWLPGRGLTQEGSSSIVALNLDELEEPLQHTTVLGYAERVYANDAVVLLTQTDYRYYTGQSTSLETNIHRFELDGASTSYGASGSFDGYVQSQFSLDELDGVVRVSTTEQSWGVPMPLPLEDETQPVASPRGPVSRILTLGKQGRRLVELGRSADFGENEQIYTTRFLGDRGYVVTFRQIDPLFVVDLSDPTAPRLAGELQLPGYSNFLFPLPEHHLLAIGQDADEQGFVQGLALQIFDVQDAEAPSLAHKYVFEEEGGSDASYDHRVVSFHPERDLLAFPFQSYVTGRSSLEVFHVSTSGGFSRLGSIQPSARDITLEDCLILLGYPPDPIYLEEISRDPSYAEYLLSECRYYQPSYRRGVFRGDELYAISTDSVAAYALEALDEPPRSSVELPPAYPYYYPYYGGMGGGAGSSGMAGAAGSAGMEPAADAGAGGAAGASMGAGGASFE